MPNKSPLGLLKQMKEEFNNDELLKNALIFALEVENWNYEAWEYIDEFGIDRQLNKQQYLLSMLKNL